MAARTRDFWCSRRHSSKWPRVRSTDFLTLLRDVSLCHVSPSARLWYQSGRTAACSAMNLAAVISMRPPLPHTDTVWGRRNMWHSKGSFVRRLMEKSLPSKIIIRSKASVRYCMALRDKVWRRFNKLRRKKKKKTCIHRQIALLLIPKRRPVKSHFVALFTEHQSALNQHVSSTSAHNVPSTMKGH